MCVRACVCVCVTHTHIFIFLRERERETYFFSSFLRACVYMEPAYRALSVCHLTDQCAVDFTILIACAIKCSRRYASFLMQFDVPV